MTRAHSALVTCGRTATALIVPATNPFIPADLSDLLNSRTGDDLDLVGAGATEPFRIAKRFLDAGLRISKVKNQVFRAWSGCAAKSCRAGAMRCPTAGVGRSSTSVATGNVDVQKVQNLLEAADGGASLAPAASIRSASSR